MNVLFWAFCDTSGRTIMAMGKKEEAADSGSAADSAAGSAAGSSNAAAGECRQESLFLSPHSNWSNQGF